MGGVCVFSYTSTPHKAGSSGWGFVYFCVVFYVFYDCKICQPLLFIIEKAGVMRINGS